MMKLRWTLVMISWSGGGSLLLSQTAGEWLARADSFEKKGDAKAAVAAYLESDKLRPKQAEVLVKIAKQYGDLMTEVGDNATRKRLGQQSLDYSQQALKADPQNADSHLAVAISIGKLVEFGGNGEKIESSREIKAQAEKALQLDPQSDYAHHMLGRWHQELAGMGGTTKAIAKMIYGGLPAASYEEALKHFDRARTLRPDRLIHQIEYGRTLAMMGRGAEAKPALLKGLAMPNRDKDDEEAKRRGRETLKSL